MHHFIKISENTMFQMVTLAGKNNKLVVSQVVEQVKVLIRPGFQTKFDKWCHYNSNHNVNKVKDFQHLNQQLALVKEEIC